MNKKILLVIVVFGIFLLIYNQPILNEQTINITSFLMRSDSIFILAILYGILLILLKKLRVNKNSYRILFILVCIYLLGLAATVITSNIKNVPISVVGWSKIIKIPICIIFGWILYILMNNYRKAVAIISNALFLSSILIVLLGILGLLFPEIQNYLGNYREGAIGANSITTFSGLTPNPWFITYYLIISYSFTWAKIVKQIYEKRLKLTIVLIIYSLLLVVVMILSGIRSILILIPLSMFINLYLYSKYISKKHYKLVLFVPLILIALLVMFQGSYLILPAEKRNTFLLRFSESSLRTSLYQYYFEVGKNSPLGVGYDYLNLAPFEAYKAPIDIVAPHNVLLSIFVISGYLGIIALLLYLLKIRRVLLFKLNNIQRMGSNQVYLIGAITAYTCSWIVYLATEIYPLSDFTHYILLSILLAA